MRSASGIGLACHLGAELAPLLQRVSHFYRVDLASERLRGAVPKIGWEAREPGAQLTMCADLPRHGTPVDPANRVAPPPASRPHYLAMIGMQVSHRRNRPLFGVVHVGCRGACSCACAADSAELDPLAGPTFDADCSYDTLVGGRVSVTHFLRLTLNAATNSSPRSTASSPCRPTQCAIDLTNSDGSHGAHRKPPRHGRESVAGRGNPEAVTEEERFRVILRALIVGHRERTADGGRGFLDPYQQDQSGMAGL